MSLNVTDIHPAVIPLANQLHAIDSSPVSRIKDLIPPEVFSFDEILHFVLVGVVHGVKVRGQRVVTSSGRKLFRDLALAHTASSGLFRLLWVIDINLKKKKIL